MDLLQRFTTDEMMIDTVKMYLSEFIRDEAGNMALRGEDVGGAKIANDMIEKAFSNLEEIYAPAKKKTEPVNEAR